VERSRCSQNAVAGSLSSVSGRLVRLSDWRGGMRHSRCSDVARMGRYRLEWLRCDVAAGLSVAAVAPPPVVGLGPYVRAAVADYESRG
jgi:hypothetical protein